MFLILNKCFATELVSTKQSQNRKLAAFQVSLNVGQLSGAYLGEGYWAMPLPFGSPG